MKEPTKDILRLLFVVAALFHLLSVFWKHHNLAKYRETQRPQPKYNHTTYNGTNPDPWGIQFGGANFTIAWETGYTKPPILQLTNNFIYLQGTWIIRVNDEQWNLITNHYRDKAEVNPPKTTLSFR